MVNGRKSQVKMKQSIRIAGHSSSMSDKRRPSMTLDYRILCFIRSVSRTVICWRILTPELVTESVKRPSGQLQIVREITPCCWLTVCEMGSDSSFLSLVTTADIKTYADLRGKTLSVDARTTGFAFVLYDMLARKGITQRDYTVVPAGGMLQRWTALDQHQQAGTLLSTPFNILARDAGFNQIATATDVIGPYQGIVAATRRTWARDHRTQLIAFIRA
jgi:hypothetical protein